MKKNYMYLFSLIFWVGLMIPKSFYPQSPWLKKTDFPGNNKRLAATFSIGKKVYVVTGVDSAAGPSKGFWEYDISKNTWTKKTDFPGSARYGAFAFSIGGKGYVGSGSSGKRELLNDLWEYNPATETWLKKTSLETGRVYSIGFSIAGKGYVGTGDTDQGNLSSDFWQYDPGKDAWLQMSNFTGGPRQLATCFQIGNKGYIGTGLGLDGAKKDLWEFDPIANSWTRKTDFKGEERHGAIGFSIYNKGFIGTGWNKTGLKDLWEYDELTDKWTEKTSFAGNSRIDAFSICVTALNRVFIGTGWNGGDHSDIWEYNYEQSDRSMTSRFSPKDTLNLIDMDECKTFPDCEIQDLKIFPNPSNSTVTLSFHVKANTMMRINILSESGQPIYTKTISSEAGDFERILDLSDKPKGIYFIQLKTEKVNVFKKLLLN